MDSYLIQGSESWKSKRRSCVTSTDAPIIMGENPWTTPIQLYRRKLGLDPEPELNDDMRRGMLLEPQARACASTLFGPLEPDVVFHKEHPFLMASLDAISPCGKYLVELKCPKISKYKQIDKQGVPLYYKGQLQHALACTGLDHMFFFCYWNEPTPIYISIVVERDDEYIERMIERERWFYKCLINFEEPIEIYE